MAKQCIRQTSGKGSLADFWTEFSRLSASGPASGRYPEPILKARQVKAALSAIRIKTDKNDACDIAKKPVRWRAKGNDDYKF